MCVRCSVRLLYVIPMLSLSACDSGSSGETVFRGPAQNTPPTAAFTTSITQGKVPLMSVQFDATQSFDSNGSITNYAWDFGDGQAASGANEVTPVHNFANVGVFTVTLTVTDNDNATNTNVASQAITVLANQPPVADFDPTAEADGLTISFDAAPSSDSDGFITDYAWDFAGLDVASGLFVTYAFPAPGDYDVSLTITDDNGDTDSINQMVNALGPNLSPTASVTTMPAPDPALGSVLGISTVTVTFDAANSDDPDGDIARFDWAFGDGQFESANADPADGSIDEDSVHTYSTLSSSLSARSVPGSLTRSLAFGDIDNVSSLTHFC